MDARDGIAGLQKAWDGEAVVTHFDRPTGSWFFIALHDATLGPPVGGCRMKPYDSPAEGLRDAMRLAEGMTYKWAALDFPFGGGKSVLALGRPLEASERAGLLRRFGRLLRTLNGAHMTGVDLGTTPEDMRIVAAEAPYVMGVSPEERESRDPGPYTALGVLVGIRVALRHALGDESPGGRRVLVQGVGDVGEPLARMLSEEGAEVWVSDLDADRGARVAGEVGGRVVAPEEAYGAECDVFAPCAVGAVLNPRTIPLLRCSVVAGSANNQLEAEEDAERLHERGILYAPDYVVNAGGAIAFGLMHRGVLDDAEIRSRVLGIGDSLSEIFAEAAAADESPARAARRRAERVLERARGHHQEAAAGG